MSACLHRSIPRLPTRNATGVGCRWGGHYSPPPPLNTPGPPQTAHDRITPGRLLIKAWVAVKAGIWSQWQRHRPFPSRVGWGVVGVGVCVVVVGCR